MVRAPSAGVLAFMIPLATGPDSAGEFAMVRHLAALMRFVMLIMGSGELGGLVAMSLWLSDPREVPAQTERVARAVLPGGSLCMRLRDTLGVVFQDETSPACSPRVDALARLRGGLRSTTNSPWRSPAGATSNNAATARIPA